MLISFDFLGWWSPLNALSFPPNLTNHNAPSLWTCPGQNPWTHCPKDRNSGVPSDLANLKNVNGHCSSSPNRRT
jgi:hypothetical protein